MNIAQLHYMILNAYNAVNGEWDKEALAGMLSKNIAVGQFGEGYIHYAYAGITYHAKRDCVNNMWDIKCGMAYPANVPTCQRAGVL